MSEVSIARQTTTPPKRRVWAALMGMVRLHRQRRALLLLDRDALDDIGITREMADQEGRRRIWDAPDHWSR